MDIVFIGASKFGRKCLEELLLIPEINITGCVTALQTFSISYNKSGVTNVLHADIKGLSDMHKIPCHVMTGNMADPELYSFVERVKPQAFIVAGWYHMIPKKWRDLAPAYGLHASILPDYSGGAPLVWAMINGERRTGITFFQFAGGVDNGPIVAQSETDIKSEDTIATLYARIEDMGLDLIRQYVPVLAKGNISLRVQDETKRRVFPQRSPNDGLINWEQPVSKIYDFIRAQTKPYPGAFFYYGNSKITVWSSRIVENFPDFIEGFFYKEGRLYARCQEGGLEIMSIAIDGKDTSIDHWELLECKGAFNA